MRLHFRLSTSDAHQRTKREMSQTKEGQTELPTPNYLKAATFHNKAGVEVKLLVYFDSGATDEHDMVNGSSVKVERTIDKGTWTAVDPIKRVELTGPEGKNCEFDVKVSGIAVLSYTIALKLVCEVE